MTIIVGNSQLEVRPWDIHKGSITQTWTITNSIQKTFMLTWEVSLRWVARVCITRIIHPWDMKGKGQFHGETMLQFFVNQICLNVLISLMNYKIFIYQYREGLIPGPQVPPRNSQETSPGSNGDRVLSVSGKKRCSHCKEELGKKTLLEA